MSKILVIYYSANGSTRKLANLIARGIEESGAEAVIRTVPRVSAVSEKQEDTLPAYGDLYATKQDLTECDGLVFGSPTRFGNMAAPLKYFVDQTSDIWMSGKLAGKPVGFFTASSSMHGGQESTILSMLIPFLHHGMLICGVPYSETELLHTTSGGTPYGASHWNGSDGKNEISEPEKKIALALGKRIAHIASKLSL